MHIRSRRQEAGGRIMVAGRITAEEAGRLGCLLVARGATSDVVMIIMIVIYYLCCQLTMMS
jgi:hypothetical protein